MIVFLVCLIKNVLKEDTYYQSELAEKFCTKHLKDKNWIIRTILKMCKNQGIIEETKYKNKNYYKVKDENKNYNKLYYFEKINRLSKNESLIKSFLDDNNIKYKMQYTFNDLIYKKKLRFDFCLEESNFEDGKFILLEYDGKQHFQEISYFHKKFNSYKEQKCKDEQKNEYANKNGYKLIRIKYTEDPIQIIKNIIIPLLK
jgi:very-short-patch-repair endonuclease